MALVAVIAAGAILFVASIPPRGERVAIPPEWRDLASRTIPGAYHIHSTRSDGSGDRSAIAAAAGRARLEFVIITDHGDATRPPDPPAYIDGVLCLDAVEISTDDGHYVALDMPRSPYPLGGSAASVVEDVARLGGFGIAAHPDSPKVALRWTDDALPVDGIEWLNADSEWRDESRVGLARAALGYIVRPAAALAELLDRPRTLARWDRWSASRPIVALAAADAHGGIGQRPDEGGAGPLGRIGIPSYEASFRTFSNRVVLDRPLTGDASADGREVFAAIRRGRVFTTIDAAAAPGLLDFTLEGTTLVARALAPHGARLVLLHRGQEAAHTDGGDLRWNAASTPGAYRLEVRVPRMPGDPAVPWLVSNELFVGGAAPKPLVSASAAGSAPAGSARAFDWHIEKDASSSAILRTTGDGVELEYQLGLDRARSPYVAIAANLARESFSGVALELSSNHPLRASVQFRGGEQARWGRSVYIDSAAAPVRVPLSSMRPLTGNGGMPDSRSLTSVLIVIDLTNSAPGGRGTVHLSAISLVN